MSPDKEVVLATVSAADLLQKMWNERYWVNPRVFLKTGQAAIAALLLQGLNEEDSQQNVELQWLWTNESLKSMHASSLFQGVVRASYSWAGEESEAIPSLQGNFQLRRVEGPSVSSGIVDSQGDIVADIQEYLKKSEQRDIALAVSLRWDLQEKNGKTELVITRAHGYCLDILPDPIQDREEILNKWQRILTVMGSPADWQLSENAESCVREMAALLFASPNGKEIFNKEANFFCTCSQEKIENIIKGLPPGDLQLQPDEKFLEVSCKFCGQIYRVGTSTLDSKSG